MSDTQTRCQSRCGWVTDDPIYIDYHDTEWGVPVRDDRKHFEFLILEGAQAGLSWITILKRREGYRRAFANFDPKKVTHFDSKNIEQLMSDVGIIRNQAKIKSAINNAKRFLEIQETFGTFDKYAWQFVDGKPLVNRRRSLSEIPPKTKESDAFSNDLKKRGFTFVGSIVIYAHMQAIGMVNDHVLKCFRYGEVGKT